jgi:hypothetical protein
MRSVLLAIPFLATMVSSASASEFWKCTQPAATGKGHIVLDYRLDGDTLFDITENEPPVPPAMRMETPYKILVDDRRAIVATMALSTNRLERVLVIARTIAINRTTGQMVVNTIMPSDDASEVLPTHGTCQTESRH